MLLDTDVLIDVALDRRPHSGPSSELLDRIERGSRRAHVAWHTLSNFYYLATSMRGDADTRGFIAALLRFVAVAPNEYAGSPERVDMKVERVRSVVARRPDRESRGASSGRFATTLRFRMGL